MKRRDARSQPLPELVTVALALLEAAGCEGDELLTTGEAAEACGIGAEAVRVWCRDGKVGFFDFRLGKFLIERRELRRFIEAHWGRVPRAFDEFVPTQSRSALRKIPMTDETKPPRPLGLHETLQLKALLARVEGFASGPVAEQLREERAEEQRLRAKQEKLKEQERQAAAHLSKLQAWLDEVSEQLDVQLARAHERNRYSRGWQPGNLRAGLRQVAGVLRERLPRIASYLAADEVAGLLEAAVEGMINPPQPPRSLRAFLAEPASERGAATAPPPPPEPTDAKETAAQFLATARRHNSPAVTPEPKKPEPPPSTIPRRH
jgi:hypothetical protein